MGSKKLADEFPDLALQWDYVRNKNNGLELSTISSGSKKDAYWICPICKHSYKKKICNRTSPTKRAQESKKCPICLGRVIIPGYNSLKVRYPKIVENEWDESNSVDPDTISPHTNKKYRWHCSYGHPIYLASANKTSQNGGNCPYCSHQKLTKENSLAVVNPQLAEEWDFELNKLSPSEVFANSNTAYFWKCKKGHSWKAKINNRNDTCKVIKSPKMGLKTITRRITKGKEFILSSFFFFTSLKTDKLSETCKFRNIYI